MTPTLMPTRAISRAKRATARALGYKEGVTMKAKKLILRVIEPPEEWQEPTDAELELAKAPASTWQTLRDQARDNATFRYDRIIRNVLSAPTGEAKDMSWDEADTSAEISDLIRDAVRLEDKQSGKNDWSETTVLLDDSQYKFMKNKLMAYKWNVADSRIRQLRRDLDSPEDVELTAATQDS